MVLTDWTTLRRCFLVDDDTPSPTNSLDIMLIFPYKCDLVSERLSSGEVTSSFLSSLSLSGQGPLRYLEWELPSSSRLTKMFEVANTNQLLYFVSKGRAFISGVPIIAMVLVILAHIDVWGILW